MGKRKTRKTIKFQNGMKLPDGVFSSRPSVLWKIMTILKENGAGDKTFIMNEMKKRWRYYPSHQQLATIMCKRTDLFDLVNKERLIYDLKGKWKDAMDREI